MAGDQSLLKRINRMAIVRHVKASPGLVRGDLAALTGLADSTISVLVAGLIEDGWLQAEDAEPRGAAGRRPKRLAIDPTRLALVGAELGVDYLGLAACSLRGDLLFSHLQDYQHRDAARSVRDAAQLVAGALRRLSAEGRAPLGVGLALPGMVSSEGLLRFAPNIGWRDAAMGPMLAEALRRGGAGEVEVQVLNDANAGALGEYLFGSPAVGSLVYLWVGYGIGAGIVLGDRLQSGHAGLSGEVGHSILRPDGEACACGRRGCAETLLSQKAVSRLVTGRAEPILHIGELLRREERGDAAVARAAREAGEHLGLVLHNLVVTIDPAVVVVGGPLSRLAPFVETARQSLARLSGQSSYHRAALRVCRFGASAGAVGAAAGVLHRLLQPLEPRPTREAR
jgi:predicted NBD/HSP70 family sugar kinase